MNFEEVWEQFTALPPAAQRQVLDFMAFLQQRYDRQGRSFGEEDFRPEGRPWEYQERSD